MALESPQPPFLNRYVAVGSPFNCIGRVVDAGISSRGRVGVDQASCAIQTVRASEMAGGRLRTKVHVLTCTGRSNSAALIAMHLRMQFSDCASQPETGV